MLLILGGPLVACEEIKYVCFLIGDPNSAETEESFKEQMEYMEAQGWKKNGISVKSNVPKPKYQSYSEYNICQEMTRKTNE